MSAEEARIRRERSEIIQKALHEFMAAQGYGGMLGDWILVASTVHVDEDGDPNSDYFMAFSGGSMLDHHALGLLSKAEDLLTDGTCRDEP